jgi:hypothetical protein
VLIKLDNQNILNNYLCAAPKRGTRRRVPALRAGTRKEKCISMMCATGWMKILSPASSSPRSSRQIVPRRFESKSQRRVIIVAISRFPRQHSALPFLIANPRLEAHLTPRKQTAAQFLIANFRRFFISSSRHLFGPSFPCWFSPSPSRLARRSPARASHSSLITRHCTMLDFAQQFPAKKFRAATADRWNFGLCATIPREPRQARKGATVTGQLRVPRITRSSSSRCRAARITTWDIQ